jgi:hypothetical protein
MTSTYEVQEGVVVVRRELDSTTGETIRTTVIAAYALPHQAEDVAAKLNQWAGREIA